MARRNMLQSTAVKVVVGILIYVQLALGALAQDAGLSMNTPYQCPNGLQFKVIACNGAGNDAVCDAESWAQGRAPSKEKIAKQQLLMLLPICRAQGSAAQSTPAQSAAKPSDAPDANGFKIGEEVHAATVGGMYIARIEQAEGDRYFVRFNASAAAWKLYPTEMRRIGPLTDIDRARGIFALHEKVQVMADGKPQIGEIRSEMGLEYEVDFGNGRSVWATAKQMQRVVVAEPSKPKAGTPPRPGLSVCGPKLEGRYGSSAGAVGSASQIIIRAGRVVLKDLGGEDPFECWTDGAQIILHKAGESNETDMPIDINDDGTLETPLGEYRRKGK